MRKKNKNKKKKKKKKKKKQKKKQHSHTQIDKKKNKNQMGRGTKKKGQISWRSTLHPRCFFFYGRSGKFGAKIMCVLVITSGWLLPKSLFL